MNKELEALERLAYAITHDVNAYSQYTQSQPFIDKDKAFVEKALKERDEFELKYAQTHVALCKSREENSKKEQALKIIREKQVDVRMFIIYDLENYNRLQKNDYCKLTKAEDDLLKEVLL